jgi:hypothetical protein
MTISYAALGDSYASGVGAGRFIVSNQTDKAKDNPCARMDGSYPWQLISNHMDERVSSLQFLACTGDELDQLDHQIKQLDAKSQDVASLSISGNDFYFAGVVVSRHPSWISLPHLTCPTQSACVYAYSGFWGEKTMQKFCQEKLELATAAIANETVWRKYRQKVRRVREKLTDDGWLYITGYSRFWSDDGALDDECSKITFFHYPEGVLGNLHLYWTTRIAMNQLVDRVNKHIKNKVVEALGGEAKHIRFIDINSGFESNRFCEPGKEPFSNETHFYSFYSELEETGTWNGPVNPDASAGVPDGSNMTHTDGLTPALSEEGVSINGLRWLWDSYRRFATFHPAKAAHEVTAKKLAYNMIHDLFP